MAQPPDINGHWNPSPAVFQRGVELQGRIVHRFGSTVAAGEQGQRPIAPGTAAAKSWLTTHFPGVFSSIGAARSPASRWHTPGQVRDLHEEGRALDLMTNDQSALERFASALVWNAETIGVQYVLTRRREWSASRIGTAWENYTGPSAHTDHVHVEFSPSVAGDAARVIRGLDAALAAGWWAPAGDDASAGTTSAVGLVAGAAAVAMGAALVAGAS